MASLVAQTVKNLPAMQGTWVRSLGWEDPLEKGKATHSSILAWRIPLIVYSFHGVAKSQTQLSDFHFHCLYVESLKKKGGGGTNELIYKTEMQSQIKKKQT